MAGATTCPECGAKVSAFAAGCASCGADLEAHHRRRRLQAVEQAERRRLPRPDLSRIPLTRYEALYLALCVALLIWLSFLAIVAGLLGVLHGYYEGRRGWVALCGLIAAAGLALELSSM